MSIQKNEVQVLRTVQGGELPNPPDRFKVGVIGSVNLNRYKTGDGREFTKVIFEVLPKGENKMIRGEMNVEFAKKYFGYCGIKGEELKGVPCFFNETTESFIGKQDGLPRTYRKIKYLNLISENGQPVIMKMDKGTVTDEPLGF